jgi:hypothetical protein
MDSQTVITIIILLLVCLLFLVAYINSKKIPEKKKDKIYEKLEEVRKQLDSNEIYARRDAIIKLDNLLGRALNLRYNNDSSFSDNLKYSKKLFNKREYQEIWDIHKKRNEIVHEDADISSSETDRAYKIYKIAIRRVLK